MSDIDERILYILKRVAIEKTHSDDMSSWCGFCEVNENYPYTDIPLFDKIEHSDACETPLARIVLKELGLCLGGYKVTCQAALVTKQGRVYGWQSVTQYIEAFTEDDIKVMYPEGTGEPKFRVPYFRDVKIERIAEI